MPNATLEIAGGSETITAVADEDGYYSESVPLSEGMNKFKITATTDDGRRAVIEPESVVHDLNAKRLEAPPEFVKSLLPYALTISCIKGVAPNRNVEDATGEVIPAQSELPITARKDDFFVNQDNQTKIYGELLEGDLPLASLNTKLAEIELDLPPNVPAGETVYVNYHVDENRNLTAELECVGRTKKIAVNLQSTTKRRHLFQDMEDLFTRFGDRLTPDERDGLERGRSTIEEIAKEIRRYEELGGDPNANWSAYERLHTEAQRFRDMMNTLNNKYESGMLRSSPF